MAIGCALLLAACGDSDSSTSTSGELSDDEASALAAVEEIRGSEEGNPFEDLSSDEMRCVAKEIVTDDDLFQSMISDVDFDNLSADQQLTAVNMFVGCAPDALADAMAEGMAEGTNLSSEDANCIAQGFVTDEAVLSELIAAGATGADPSAQVMSTFFELMESCDISLADLG